MLHDNCLIRIFEIQISVSQAVKPKRLKVLALYLFTSGNSGCLVLTVKCLLLLHRTEQVHTFLRFCNMLSSINFTSIFHY